MTETNPPNKFDVAAEAAEKELTSLIEGLDDAAKIRCDSSYSVACKKPNERWAQDT